jgi:CheY-like chemotaxis protein
MTILAVDDDPDDLYLFKEAVKEVNPNGVCLTAFSCREAIKILDSNIHPDFIFIDINMPLTGGLECMKHIRQDKRYDNTPIIIVSTEIGHQEIELCKKFRASYFKKPTSFEILVNKISQVIS